MPDVVAGPAANTEAAVALVHQLSGLPALNLLDRTNYPILARMLAAALEHDIEWTEEAAGHALQ